MSDVLPRIAAVLNPLMSEHKMTARYPLPVWDDTGSLIGVTVSQDKRMGHQDCIAEASFVLSPRELNNPEAMKAKAMLAVNIINAEVQMTIRPKRKAKNAA